MMENVCKVLLSLVFVLLFTVAFSQYEEIPMEEDPPPTAAEQYLDFITSQGQKEALSDEDGGMDGSLGPTVPPEEGEEDFSGEVLRNLLRPYREQFENLSIDKKKSKLIEDIKTMDLDEDGYISKPELVTWLTAEAEKGSHVEAKGLGGIQSFDINDDKKLSWEEVLEDLKKLGSMSNPSFLKGLKMEKIRFEHADKDKDGFLSDAEYPYYATPEYFSSMNNYTMLSYLNDFDSDDDFKVTKEEYLQGFDKQDTEGMKIEEEKFDKMDKDKNGFLTADEVADIALGYTLTRYVDQHADMIFVKADADKDGKLSSVEIISNYPILTKGDFESEAPSEEEQKHDEL